MAIPERQFAPAAVQVYTTRMFFDSWTDLGRVVVMAVLAYAALVVTLRASGKRTLAKMNAFDLVVTVALGSLLATIILSSDVALAEGVLAIVMLAGLQMVVAWLAVRSATVRRIVKSEPRLLFHRGQFLSDAMRGERVTEDEVLSAIRKQGLASLEQVEAVVLETDGTFSALSRHPDHPPTALRHVNGAAAATDAVDDA